MRRLSTFKPAQVARWSSWLLLSGLFPLLVVLQRIIMATPCLAEQCQQEGGMAPRAVCLSGSLLQC